MIKRTSLLNAFVVTVVSGLATLTHAQDTPGISVAVETIETGPVTQWIFLEGIAEAARKEYLYFERPGRIIEIANGDDGEALRAGARASGDIPFLARIDDRETLNQLEEARAAVAAARERVRAAEAVLEQARLALARQERLSERGTSTRAALEEAQAAFTSAEAQLSEARAAVLASEAQVRSAELAQSYTLLRAPFDGVVSLMNVRVGDFVGQSPGETSPREREASAAVVLIDDTSFEVTLFVPPYQAIGVQEGQRVLVGLSGAAISNYAKTGSDPLVVEADVWSVSPSVSLQNRAVEVKVRTNTETPFLSDGDFVSAWIAVNERENALRVPYTALIDQDRKLFTFVLSEDGTSVEMREIPRGLEGLTFMEATEGLVAGDRVVTRGQHLLANGSPVRLVSEGN
ncbi:MAG: efflux RND transporter periplasmic adaptor subunit [Roseovarius sp.]|jgi:RND family efflux transporter MFP subunit|nr:efflux RND transporter periplasmic adaptor subunit [Roseovarius sp.]